MYTDTLISIYSQLFTKYAYYYAGHGSAIEITYQ